MVQNKRILKEIAKRWCKGIIFANEASVSFEDTGLSSEEIDCIEDECKKIMERITKEDLAVNTESLVNEYYE